MDQRKGSMHADPPAVYEIQVLGELGQGWQQWLGGLAATPGYSGDRSPVTTLTGPVTDQAALRGMLCRLWDLNLTVISVRRMESGGEQEEGDERSKRF
jgi:hypothetical protein